MTENINNIASTNLLVTISLHFELILYNNSNPV